MSDMEVEDLLGLSNAADQLVPAVTHNGAHAEKEDSRSEALGRQISLNRIVSFAHSLPWRKHESIFISLSPSAQSRLPTPIREPQSHTNIK
jgi:hypothetical protein